ncbi:MAG: hypothetical protein SP1CHLAM54_14370 [Chlamydiia bacterium]|nr:hypothetical protein [Chlamydiia bacterium]MCH9616329.1 hypothetical protein [Chlamydiia bacterium]MCH9629685.1 hypothetical protein [Chlamydiia bacterium]
MNQDEMEQLLQKEITLHREILSYCNDQEVRNRLIHQVDPFKALTILDESPYSSETDLLFLREQLAALIEKVQALPPPQVSEIQRKTETAD